MANEYTGRFQWPIPPWNADWQKWQQLFGTFAQGADATAFALLEHLTLIHRQLPTVEVTNAPGAWTFTQVDSAIFISRTLQVEISVGPNDLTLVRGGLICADLQPGAVGPQAVQWELDVSQTEISSSRMVFGVVNDDYTIQWFNGARLDLLTPTTLFAFPATGGSGWMTGAGNPNGVVTALAGTPYRDTLTGVIYMNIDGAMTWSVI
ncbi:MAG: hypothetical protein WC683_01575 [bacterium]